MVVVETDSKAMILTIKGETDSCVEAETLIAYGKAIMKIIRGYEIMHVLREENQCTDYPANLG